MLILSRKKGESIIIGEDIEIFVADVKGDKVRLGISAPEDMKISRKELYLTVENNKEASDKSGSAKGVPAVPQPVCAAGNG